MRFLTALTVLSTSLAFGQGSSVQALQVSYADHRADVVAGSFGWRGVGLKGSKDPDGIFPVLGHHDVPSLTPQGFYPADVSNPGNGPTIVAAEHNPIYINKPPSHWGAPGAFLSDLSNSNFIHVLDQYVGFFANNRYPLGDAFQVPYTIPSNQTLQLTDLLTIVHAVAGVEGSGLHHIYHLFIPQGVDVCLPGSNNQPPACYSPDNPSTFVFCGFHSTVTFADSVGHVVFTVQPFQDVAGCSAPPTGTANGQLIDSTDDTLAHETFEVISDPDLDAWFVNAFTFAVGNEIADLCVRAQVIGQNVYSDNGTVRLNGHPYTIQSAYSNTFHGCVYTP